MEKIYYQKTLVALHIKSFPAGSIPLTDPKEPLQLVTLKHPKDTYLRAHFHRPRKRITKRLQECLMVKRGKIKVDLYTPKQVFLKALTVQKGEILIMVNGGYGIHILDEAELIEVKNGPFKEDKVLI